jgi:hypothetical protein
MSTGNIKKKMFLGSKVRPVHGADNLTAIYGQQQNARPSTIKLHADGNLTSKLIDLVLVWL